MNASASVAARVAGAIGALGYLSGMVDGPIIGAIAGLALITFGRSALSPKGSELIAPAAFGVLAGAAGSVALRWGTLDLTEIQGVQGVLGPTIAVEPLQVALLTAGALAAGCIALGLWLGARDEQDRFLRLWWWIECLAGAAFLAGLFSGPPLSDVVQAGIRLGATVVIGAVAAAIGTFGARWAIRTRGIVLGSCGAVVAAAAVVAGSYA